MVDFLSSQIQYSHHLLPVWFALPPEERGTFWAVDKAASKVQAEVGDHFKRTYPTLKGPLTVVASYHDFRSARKAGREVVLLNHGAGQRYTDGPLKNHPAYVGGSGRKDIALFLEPGPYAGQITRETGGSVVEVGVPKLDTIHRFPAEITEPVVAVSWHWHCVSGVPETDWAYPEYKDAVVELSKQVKVIGHAHPRAWQRMERWYREVGIEPVESFSEVLQRASVFVADNTSALYEFASTTRPVVVLNSKYYRRNVSHGLRFWGLIPGIQVDYSEDLLYRVKEALEGRPSVIADVFQDTIKEVYHSTDGKAAERAAQAILELGATMTDPYRPRRVSQIPERKPDPPQFPLARLKRIGASTREIEAARGVWDSMDSPEEQFAAAEEFSAMGDVELRAALQEQKTTPDFNAMTIPEVMDWIGSSKAKAQIALDNERAREGSDEGDGRKTLINKLKRMIDA